MEIMKKIKTKERIVCLIIEGTVSLKDLKKKANWNFKTLKDKEFRIVRIGFDRKWCMDTEFGEQK